MCDRRRDYASACIPGGVLTEVRVDQKRMVRCAAASDSASKTSLPCSSAIFVGIVKFGRFRIIMLVVGQLSPGLDVLQRVNPDVIAFDYRFAVRIA